MITHVWSSFGHTFLSTGDENLESCLTCGGTWELVPRADDPTGGVYQTADGSDPMPCTGNTGLVHGIEREYDGCNWNPAPCAHVTHECNCLLCA
jgi:hypothetical protein